MSILADRPATVIPTGTWEIDSTHSSVEFEIRHLGLATVKGRAPVVSGTIVGGELPSIQGTVDVSSVTTFDETRDGHLSSPDFFDTARWPQVRFSSTRVEIDQSGLVAEGDLTIRDVTKPVTLRGELVGTGADPWGNERIGIDLATTIDRTDWGLSWNAPVPGGGFLLPDTVKLTASFSAIKKA